MYGTAQAQCRTCSHKPFCSKFKISLLRGVATVLLAILMSKTASTLSHERNSCHAPYLAIFKISSKIIVHVNEYDVALGQHCIYSMQGNIGWIRLSLM